MAFVKSLRDAVLTLQDGTTPTATLMVSSIEEGDLKVTETRNVTEIMHRGTLSAVKSADDAPLEVSFSARFSSFEAPRIASTQLDGALTDSATTITVDSTTGFSGAGSGRIDSSNGTEIFTWTGKTATTMTGVTRGLEGTTAVAHADNAPLYQYSGGDRTLREFITLSGGYAGLVSTRTTSKVKTVDLIWALLDKDDNVEEIVTIEDFYLQKWEVTEGDPYNLITVSGRAFNIAPAIS